MKLSESALSRLTYQHLTITEIVEAVPDARLHFNPAPGKWSINDNIAHLARYNVIFRERLKKIQEQDAQQYPRYNAEADPEFPLWKQKSTAELLQSISMEREIITREAQSYSEAALNRIGVHPKFGRLTVIDWIEFYLLHEAHHIFTIYKLKNDVPIVAGN